MDGELNKVINKMTGRVSPYSKVASICWNANTNAKIAHVSSEVYAKHIALGEFYEGIDALVDRFVESTQGTHEMLLRDFEMGTCCVTDIRDYLKGKMAELVALRPEIKEGHLAQILDEIIELFSITNYKLKFLPR